MKHFASGVVLGFALGLSVPSSLTLSGPSRASRHRMRRGASSVYAQQAWDMVYACFEGPRLDVVRGATSRERP
eukprot:4917834-Prymnesium_polylepis.1